MFSGCGGEEDNSCTVVTHGLDVTQNLVCNTVAHHSISATHVATCDRELLSLMCYTRGRLINIRRGLDEQPFATRHAFCGHTRMA